LRGPRPQRILRQVAGRFNRASGATHIVQLDLPKGSLGPALGIQHVLCLHSLVYHSCKMWGRIRLKRPGRKCAFFVWGS
jgi:hypothetical protein